MFFRKTGSTKTILAGTVLARVGAAFGVVVTMSLSPASAGMFDGVADAIVCPLPPVAGRPGGLVVFYVDARVDNGNTVYRPMGQSAIRLTVDTNGVVQSTNLAECHGKTVQQLREAGRAFDFR